jgi:putative tryptophan/tyrosine transport system substrate-binding protein
LALDEGEGAMRRRDFIAGIAGLSAVRPLASLAQQPKIPMIGFLNIQSAKNYQRQVAAFLDGLAEGGYVDGRNVRIEYRWAEGHSDRLPALMSDLIDKNVAVIAATSTPAALAAKAAGTKIPIVFETSFDPIRLGLVTSLARPTENITGVSQQSAVLLQKKMEVLHELVPGARVIGLLVNPTNPLMRDSDIKDAGAAAKSLNLTLQVLDARSEHDFENVFAKFAQLGAAGSLVIGSDTLFTSQRALLGELAARHAMPAITGGREFVDAGGLVSYGSNIFAAYRLAGTYVARILKGEKPGDLPVQQGTQFELFINAKAAKALNITIPIPLSGAADGVIE